MKPGYYGIIGLAALLIAGCSNQTRAAFEKAAAELPAAEAAARKLGLPLTGADLMPTPPVRPENNAAPLLRRAGADYRLAAGKVRGWEQTLIECYADPTPANLAKAQATLRPLDPSLDLAVQASGKPEIDFQRLWTMDEPWNMTFPELSECKNLTKGLSYRAQLRARQGDSAGAMSDLRAVTIIGQFLASEPTLIGSLVRVAIDAIVVRTAEYALTIRPRDERFLKELDALAAKQIANPAEMLHALRGEIVFGVAATEVSVDSLVPMATGMVDEADTQGMANQSEWRKRLAPPGVPEETRRKAFRARALQTWVEVFSSAEGQASPVALVKRLEEIDERIRLDRDPTLAMHEIFFPTFAGAGDALLTGQARWVALRGLVAVLRFKRAEGRYPGSLAEAGFKELDPFTEQPLRIKVDGETVRVYSVGPDGVDNDGQERVNTPPNAPRQMDIVLQYPRRMTVPGAPVK